MVITPYYVDKYKTTYVVFDQFQQLRVYNLSYVCNKQNHKGLILMSATPDVPLLGAFK